MMRPAAGPPGAGVRAAPPVLSVFDDAFLRDPYPVYRALREVGPVHWSEDFSKGAWLLTRHEDVERVLRDVRFSSQRTGGWVKRIEGVDLGRAGRDTESGLTRFQRLFARAMVFLDAPEHTRLRRVMAAGFHPTLIRDLAPQIEQMVADLLDGLDAASGFDFIESVARPLPSRVIALLLGIREPDEAQFFAWADDLAVFIGALQPSAAQLRAAQRSLLQLVSYFESLLKQGSGLLGDGLIRRLARAQSMGLIQADGELLAQCAMMLFAGHETTRNLLGNGLFTLLSHPGQWASVAAQAEQMPGALREVLRYDSPVQYTGRRVSASLSLHGHHLRRGDLVIALIGSANHDPTRYVDPERFDISRRQGSHLPLAAARMSALVPGFRCSRRTLPCARWLGAGRRCSWSKLHPSGTRIPPCEV